MPAKRNPTRSDAEVEASRRTTGHVVRRELLHGQPSPPVDLQSLLAQYGCGPIPLTGTGDALYERHILFDSVIDPGAAGPRSGRGRGKSRLTSRWLGMSMSTSLAVIR